MEDPFKILANGLSLSINTNVKWRGVVWAVGGQLTLRTLLVLTAAAGADNSIVPPHRWAEYDIRETTCRIVLVVWTDFFLQFCSRNGWTFCHFSTLQYLTSSSVCVSHEHHRGGLRFLLWLIQYCPWRPFWYFPVLGLSESVNFHPDNCPYGRTITWATAKTFKAAAFSISSHLSFTIQLLL